MYHQKITFFYQSIFNIGYSQTQGTYVLVTFFKSNTKVIFQHNVFTFTQV